MAAAELARTLQDLEKLAPKKGVIAQSVKEVLQVRLAAFGKTAKTGPIAHQ